MNDEALALVALGADVGMTGGVDPAAFVLEPAFLHTVVALLHLEPPQRAPWHER